MNQINPFWLTESDMKLSSNICGPTMCCLCLTSEIPDMEKHRQPLVLTELAALRKDSEWSKYHTNEMVIAHWEQQWEKAKIDEDALQNF